MRRAEHVTCEPYFCQSAESPRHPFLARVLVNKVAFDVVSDVDDVVAAVARGHGLVEEDDEPYRPPRWSLELAVFPGELLRFASYIADLVRTSERRENEVAVEPPMPAEVLVESEGIHGTRALYLWSERAWYYFEDRVWMDEIVPSNAHFMALRQRRSARR